MASYKALNIDVIRSDGHEVGIHSLRGGIQGTSGVAKLVRERGMGGSLNVAKPRGRDVDLHDNSEAAPTV